MVGLPLDMMIRAGFMGSRIGYWNDRASANRTFVETPLAIGRLGSIDDLKAIKLTQPPHPDLRAALARATKHGE